MTLSTLLLLFVFSQDTLMNQIFALANENCPSSYLCLPTLSYWSFAHLFHHYEWLISLSTLTVTLPFYLKCGLTIWPQVEFSTQNWSQKILFILLPFSLLVDRVWLLWIRNIMILLLLLIKKPLVLKVQTKSFTTHLNTCVLSQSNEDPLCDTAFALF